MIRVKSPSRRLSSKSSSSSSPCPNDLELRIRTLAGDLCTISVAKSQTIADVKRCISSASRIPCNEQRLFLSGQELSDSDAVDAVFEGVSGELSLLRVPNNDYWCQRLSRNGMSLRQAPESIRGSRELVRLAMNKHPGALSFASEDIRSDRALVSEAIQRTWAALKHATAELKADRDIVRSAVLQDGRALEFATPELREDRGLVSLAVERSWAAFKHASPELKQDEEIVALAVRSGMPLLQAPACMHTNRTVLAASFHRDGSRLRFASDEDKADFDFVAAALMQSGKALKYAAPALQANRDLVRLALQQDGSALEYAAPEFRADRELVSLALQHPAQARLDFVDDSIYTDGVITVAMHSNSALRFASEDLRSDRDLVHFAVEINGRALQYASTELRSDRDLVLVAVSQNWAALRHAADAFKADPDVVLAAMRQDKRALRYATESVKRQLGAPAGEAQDAGHRREATSTLAANSEKMVSSKTKYEGEPLVIPLDDLARHIDDAKDRGQRILILSEDDNEVETFFNYDTNVQIDCKQLLRDVYINKTKSKQQAQVDLCEALVEAHNSQTFCKPLHCRMANVAFDWVDLCEGFPVDVFSGKRWTVETAFAQHIVDESQRLHLESDPEVFKDFTMILTSTFDLDDAYKFLSDKIPFFDEWAVLVVESASFEA